MQTPPLLFFFKLKKKRKSKLKKADFLLPFISKQLTDTDTLCYNNVVLKEYLYSRHDAKAPGVPSVKIYLQYRCLYTLYNSIIHTVH